MIKPIIRNAGIQPKRILSVLKGWRRYARDRKIFYKMEESSGWPLSREMPMLCEWDECSGTIGAYFLQDQCVARWVYANQPIRHVDVGSRLDGFIGNLSIFREIDVIDIRPQNNTLTNIHFHQLDVMKDLPEAWIECTDSLSCLHTIEHFGLGRYGDPIDPCGHLKGLQQLQRMVKSGGLFYLSTPIGTQRTEFNAHRITAGQTMCDWFKDGWQIEKCAILDDTNQFSEGEGAKLLSEFCGTLGLGIVAARRI